MISVRSFRVIETGSCTVRHSAHEAEDAGVSLHQGDHYSTRLTHTLEVSQNARTIGKALRLNEDLVEAIALGHDLGILLWTCRGESSE